MANPKPKVVEVTTEEIVELRPAGSISLITLYHIDGEGEMEVAPLQWAENRARLELAGWRHPDEEREVLTPPGERYTHSTGTGFVRE